MNFKGIIHHVDSKQCWASNGSVIYKTTDRGNTWIKSGTLALPFGTRLKSAHRITRRLFRAGIHHIVPTGEDKLVIFGTGMIYDYKPSTGISRFRASVQGSRPLHVCTSSGGIYYGEYRRNPERSSVHIWFSDDSGTTWNPAYRFTNVRHIHGVFSDMYTGDLWVTTGDKNPESAVWVTTDQFRTIEKVVWGTQQTRCVGLVFTERYVYFGSDAPNEINYIYRLVRKTGEVERLQPVDGPVFWGCKVKRSLFFSTACEPSRVNKSGYAVIWRSDDGERWYEFKKFRKDIWSMKYFQYGQVLFPGGDGDDRNLWCTPFATACDQQSLRLPIYNEQS